MKRTRANKHGAKVESLNEKPALSPLNVVIGIDADTTAIAWACFEDGRYKRRGTIARILKGRVIKPYRLDVQRLFCRAAEVGAAVFVEDVFLARGPKGKPLIRPYKALCRLQGELVHIADGVGLELNFVSCLDWHRGQLGFTKGRDALQAASHERAAELAGAPVESPHEADAVVIAAHGAGLCPQVLEEAGAL